MKKYLKITLISLLMIIIILSGLLFTQQGNDLLKPYLKSELEKQIGLPVDVGLFKLRYDHTALKVVVNKALSVDVESIFNLLGLNFDGTYKIYANNFMYNNISLEQANINGEFKGVPDDIYVNGKGSSFDAPLNYYLRILKGDAKEITIQLKEMDLADILRLTKQPDMAKGKVDANVTIPTLVENELNAHGEITFSDITFNDELMKKLYKVSMPEAMKVNGIIDANVTDTQVMGSADMKSNIANIHLKDLHFDRETKHVSSQYLVDILNLKALSGLLRTKMNGAILLEGEIEKKETLKLTGLTKSLGGEIHYRVLNKNFTASLDAVPAKNMLHMFRFPAFVDAQASGSMDYHIQDKRGGTKLALKEFRLASNKVTKSLELVILKDPSSIVFGETSLDAAIQDDEINYTLMAKALDASITVDEAVIHNKRDTHNAKIAFRYNKFAIEGSIEGSVRHPRVGFETKGIMPDIDFADKAEKEIEKFFKRLF